MKKRTLLFLLAGIAVLIIAALVGGFLSMKEEESPPDTATSTSTQERPQTVMSATPDQYATARENMVKDQIASRDVEDEAVLAAMRAVPRHAFVLDRYLDQAYRDHPLPIGYGQTISQPYIVALMTEVLEVEAGDRVLEVGTGSGYQAAVLAELDTDVYTVEIIPELATQAEERLDELGYSQVQVRSADGYFGWEEHAPFDAIIVTAAPDHLPHPLTEQLKEGGRLVIPIGPIGAVQTLWVFEKVDGELESSSLGPVRFVPLTGER